MKLFNKISLIIFLIPLAIAASDLKKHEKTKTISKKFNVKSNATLYIKNKYGAVNVTTWDKNTIEIEVKIIVKGGNIEKVNEKLNTIHIDFEANESLVEARTRIENTKSSWSWWGNNSKNISYKINYYIKMPITNNADLNNKYGSIDIDVLEGKANIDCDYGSIQVEKLLNKENSINLDYCGNSTINFLKSGNINADYSKIAINNSEELKINADYTTVKIGKTKKINFNCDYGSVAINDVESVNGKLDYAGISIGTVRTDLNINVDYGSLKIKDLVKGFNKVYVDASYTGIKIGTSAKNDFTFLIDLSYASFKYPDNYVQTTKSIKKGSKKYYEGSFGNENSNSKIQINSNYGGVSLKLND